MILNQTAESRVLRLLDDLMVIRLEFGMVQKKDEWGYLKGAILAVEIVEQLYTVEARRKCGVPFNNSNVTGLAVGLYLFEF